MVWLTHVNCFTRRQSQRAKHADTLGQKARDWKRGDGDPTLADTRSPAEAEPNPFCHPKWNRVSPYIPWLCQEGKPQGILMGVWVKEVRGSKGPTVIAGIEARCLDAKACRLRTGL